MGDPTFTRSATQLYIVGMLILLGMLIRTSLAQGADALNCLNARRAHLGLYPLAPDPQLQALAERESQMQANRGRMGHILGSPSPARAAGVGMKSGRDYQGRWFNACYAVTRKYRYAGAAAVVGSRGTYYTLMLR